MVLPSEWTELLRVFQAHRVRFLIVGAHALAAHGRPRYTADLDLFVEASRPNAWRVLRALDQFGFGGVGLSEADFARPGSVVRLGRPPMAVDLLTSISGVSFDWAWRGRRRGVLDGIRVAFLGLTEYRINKRAAGRPKDRADLALIDEAARARPRRRRRLS